MYVDPFLAGVLSTVLVELTIVAAIVIRAGFKEM